MKFTLANIELTFQRDAMMTVLSCPSGSGFGPDEYIFFSFLNIYIFHECPNNAVYVRFHV